MKIIPILFKIISKRLMDKHLRRKIIYIFFQISIDSRSTTSSNCHRRIFTVITEMREPRSNSNPISLVPRNFTRQQFQEVEEIGLIFMGWGKGSWFKFLMRWACISVDSAPFCRGLGKLLRYFGVKSPAGISRIMWWKLKLRNAYFKSCLI